jgi:CheY-like chemotaxis protein
MLVRTLHERGYVVLEASNGEQALLMVQEQPDRKIDLLVTDMVMPGFGGNFLAERLKTICPTLKVLFMSGYTDQVITGQDVLGQENNFLSKPFMPDDLARKVRQVLDENYH